MAGMIDDFDGDWYDDGDNYDYVEDGYDMADDLAAHAVPDPPEYDGQDYWDDHTRYEFWNDIEYDTDGYHDVKTRRKPKPKSTTETITPFRSSRKRAAPSSNQKSNKKRKTETRRLGHPPVLLVDRKYLAIKPVRIADLTKLKSVSILPGWRQFFSSTLDANSLDEHDPEAQLATQEDEEMDEDVDPSEIEADALTKALHANLGKFGIGANLIPQDLLLKMAAKMMSGDVEDDEGTDILEQLVQGVHATEEDEDKDTRDGFSKWVSGQLKPASQDAVDPKLPLTDQEENTNPAIPKPKPAEVETSTSPRGNKRKRVPSTAKSRKKTSQIDHVSAKG